MNISLLKTKIIEISKEFKSCNDYLVTRYPDKWKMKSHSFESILINEILRIYAYLNYKNELTENTIKCGIEILSDFIHEKNNLDHDSFKRSIEDYFNKNQEFVKELEFEYFSLNPLLEGALEYDERYFTNKFDLISNLFFQIINLIIKSDHNISPIEENLLKNYNKCTTSKKYKNAGSNFSFQLGKIYDDFFNYTNEESIDKQKDSIAEEVKNEPIEIKKTLEEQMESLNQLVGLDSVKNEIQSLTNLLKIEKIRKEKGFSIPEKSLHMVFAGNPGTGKTTVARILAGIFHSLGVLQKGQLVEVDRSGLIAGFVGQTATKTLEVCKKALDGVLFIDEAYSLSEGGENDFGKEAINTILKYMEDNRSRIIVIVAGYTKNMEEFISKNSGLESRFNKYIFFEDYNPESLFKILSKLTESMKLIMQDDTKKYVLQLITEEYNLRDSKFGNARFVRNLFEKAYMKQANRLVTLAEVTEESLCTLLPQDFQ